MKESLMVVKTEAAGQNPHKHPENIKLHAERQGLNLG